MMLLVLQQGLIATAQERCTALHWASCLPETLDGLEIRLSLCSRSAKIMDNADVINLNMVQRINKKCRGK